MSVLVLIAGALRGALNTMHPDDANAIREALAERVAFARESFELAKGIGASLADVADQLEQAQRAFEAFNRAHPHKR